MYAVGSRYRYVCIYVKMKTINREGRGNLLVEQHLEHDFRCLFRQIREKQNLIRRLLSHGSHHGIYDCN